MIKCGPQHQECCRTCTKTCRLNKPWCKHLCDRFSRCNLPRAGQALLRASGSGPPAHTLTGTLAGTLPCACADTFVGAFAATLAKTTCPGLRRHLCGRAPRRGPPTRTFTGTIVGTVAHEFMGTFVGTFVAAFALTPYPGFRGHFGRHQGAVRMHAPSQAPRQALWLTHSKATRL